jgi:hypothetical protein
MESPSGGLSGRNVVGVAVESPGGVDQAHVGEGLGEVPGVAAGGRIDLLGEEPDVVGPGGDVGEQGAGAVAFTGEYQAPPAGRCRARSRWC